MSDVYAFIIGIEKYDQPDWDVTGPSANAIAVADWLLTIKIPGDNIFVFLDAKESYGVAIDGLRAKNVKVVESATWEELDTFWRSRLAGCAADSCLLVFWSGHGFTANDGSRIFFCRDYLDLTLSNRVFNASGFLRHLRSSDFACFKRQIFLADVCGVYSDLPYSAAKDDPKDQSELHQIALFATPEGKYAKGNNGRGVFTEMVLAVLQQTNAWPDFGPFMKAVREALEKVGQTPFRIFGFDDESELGERIVGSMPPGGDLFNLVTDMLLPIELPDTVFRPHYLRTANDLGLPDLAKAQGLTGMRELASLKDVDSPRSVPYGLLQFLVRLGQEEKLKQTIDTWLKKNASTQGNDLANIREKIRVESGTRILVIEVQNDGSRQDFGISAFRPELRPFAGGRSGVSAGKRP